MINGEKFLVTGKNISLLLGKLNLKKIPFYDLEELENKIYITIQKKDITRFVDLIGKTWYYKSIKKGYRCTFTTIAFFILTIITHSVALPHSKVQANYKQENSHFHTHHLQTLQYHTSQLCKNVANRVQNQACLCYAEVPHIFAIRLQLQSCKVLQQN